MGAPNILTKFSAPIIGLAILILHKTAKNNEKTRRQ
jgi:hypothetical protein